MKIVVNHLTRMQKGCMCVAGIDLETRLPVRPVLDRQMTNDMLSVHGGPFDMGRIVDLGKTRFDGRVPEVEDQRFDAKQAHHIGDMPPDEFWNLLGESAHKKLGSIFGPDLQPVGTSCAVTETHGLRSLGCYLAADGRLLFDQTRSNRRVRFSFCSGEYEFNVPVTDIRLYAADHVTPDETMIQQIGERIAESPSVLVSVGLSRAYRKSPDDPPQHWLQINNFHLQENPCWSLAKQITV